MRSRPLDSTRRRGAARVKICTWTLPPTSQDRRDLLESHCGAGEVRSSSVRGEACDSPAQRRVYEQEEAGMTSTDMGELSDEELVELVRRADRSDLRAFDALVRRYQDRVTTNCRHISGPIRGQGGVHGGGQYRDRVRQLPGRHGLRDPALRGGGDGHQPAPHRHQIVRILTWSTLGCMVLAFGLSFGLGTRDITRNIIAGFYVRKTAITPTQTLLDQDGTMIAVANSVFLEQTVRHTPAK